MRRAAVRTAVRRAEGRFMRVVSGGCDLWGLLMRRGKGRKGADGSWSFMKRAIGRLGAA